MATANVDGERVAMDTRGDHDRETDALLEHVERLIARAFGSLSDDEEDEEEGEEEEEGDEQQEQQTVSSSSSTATTTSADGPNKRLLMRANPEEEVEPPSSSSSSSSSLQAAQQPADGLPSNTETDTTTSREKVLQRKLARTLLELADARDNAQLAARAGTVLLEKLGRAVGDADALRDELEAAVRENARLQRVVGAMDDQLRRFELVETPSRRRSEQPASSWRSPSSFSSVRTEETCRECEERRQDARTARQERDQLRRQCLELELQLQGAHQTESDRRRELERANDWARRLQSELSTASSDRDALAERHQALQEENARLAGVRETLRTTVKALRADKRALSDRLGQREQQVEELERDKREFATRAQIADNRRARAERDSERLLQTLAELSRVRRSEVEQPAEEQPAEEQHEAIDDRDVDRERRKTAGRIEREGAGEATTAADLLRLDSSGSDASETPATSLSIDTSEALAFPSSLLPAPVVRVRPQHAQWALPLPQDASSSLSDAPTTTSSPSPVTPSTVVPRRAALVKRLSGVNHYCIAGSSAGVNGPDIRLLEEQQRTDVKQQPRGETPTATDDSDKKSEAAPPPSPMYIGLSLLVACATAAGIAARR